jgi:DNA-binding GntR family transcriptional regulator
MPDSSLAQAGASSLKDMAHRTIRAAIISMELAPGQPLLDRKLSEQLQMSRTPIREALRQLEQEGLVVRREPRGWQVHSLSPQDIRDIFDIKEELEGFAARRVTEKLSSEDAARLMSIVRSMEESADRNDLEEWMDHDAELHRLMFSILGNDRLESFIRTLNDQWHGLRIGYTALKGRLKVACTEHKWVVEAMCAGDAEGAETAMRSHLHSLREDLLTIMENLLLPFLGDRSWGTNSEVKVAAQRNSDKPSG